MIEIIILSLGEITIMVEIRQVSEKDLEHIAKINTDNWKSTYESILPESYLNQLTVKDSMAKWEKFINNPTHSLQVIEIDDQIAGFVAVSIDENVANALYVDSLHVSHHFQRQGLGTKLLTAVLTSAKNDNKAVTIAILKGNENARNLYTKLGAVHLADFTDHFGNVVTQSEKLIWA